MSDSPADSPQLNLQTDVQGSLSSPSDVAGKRVEGVWGDMLDEVGIPHEVFVDSGRVEVHGETLARRLGGTGRPLDKEEKSGVYTLLGILAGSAVLGGIVAPKSG